MANGLLLFMTDIDPALEVEFNRWYEEEHLGERMAIPGFITARRFQAIEGSPKYLAIYDLESPDVLQSAPYRHIVGPGVGVDQAHGTAVRQQPAPCLCWDFRTTSLIIRIARAVGAEFEGQKTASPVWLCLR
jgi:hypothetical protein